MSNLRGSGYRPLLDSWEAFWRIGLLVTAFPLDACSLQAERVTERELRDANKRETLRLHATVSLRNYGANILLGKDNLWSQFLALQVHSVDHLYDHCDNERNRRRTGRENVPRPACLRRVRHDLNDELAKLVCVLETGGGIEESLINGILYSVSQRHSDHPPCTGAVARLLPRGDQLHRGY